MICVQVTLLLCTGLLDCKLDLYNSICSGALRSVSDEIDCLNRHLNYCDELMERSLHPWTSLLDQ